ncbi:hypothetical protein BT69DRAFT_1284728 [Atractiella rhizophila]|nr:hypothetical protein BT69DRAFT_1284728 [Atractiella rhizophila]
MRTLTEQTQKLNKAKQKAQEVLKEEAARRLASEKEAAARSVTDKQVARKVPAKKPPVSKVAPPPAATKAKPRPVTNVEKNDASPPVEPAKPPAKKGKKKRSALANANNVHHRDNYVPSRLPNSAPTPTHGGLSHSNSYNADDPIHPGTPGDPVYSSSLPSYFAGVDEWLCAFCEYKIFFGEDTALASCIKKRKKVLRIRKRAQERAAKAANGGTATPSNTGNLPQNSHLPTDPRPQQQLPPQTA